MNSEPSLAENAVEATSVIDAGALQESLLRLRDMERQLRRELEEQRL